MVDPVHPYTYNGETLPHESPAHVLADVPHVSDHGHAGPPYVPGHDEGHAPIYRPAFHPAAEGKHGGFRPLKFLLNGLFLAAGAAGLWAYLKQQQQPQQLLSGGNVQPPRTLPPVPVPRPTPSAPPPLAPWNRAGIEGDEYVVAPNDTLYHISRVLGADTSEIVSANKDRITDPDLIYPSQRIRLPADGAAQHHLSPSVRATDGRG